MKKTLLLFLITLLAFCTVMLCVSCKQHTEHSYGEWKVVSEATCTVKGERERECTECGNKQTEEIPMLQHEVENFEVVRAPDCVTDGKKSGVCKLCNQTVEVTVKALGHDVSQTWTVGNATHWHYCARCEAKLDESAHVLKDGVCETCGYCEQVLAELTYELLTDGTYAVTGYTNKEQANAVDIPSTYQGKQVTIVGMMAFMNDKIKSITIAEGITTLKSYCFWGTGIATITLPDSVTVCEKNAFQQSVNLETVNLGCGLTEIPERMFYQCGNLKHINIPDCITSIGNYAFAETGLETFSIKSASINIGKYAFSKCENLQKIIFEEGVENIMSVLSGYHFSNCSNLTEIQLPSTVNTIYKYFFNNAPSLQSIKVDEANETFCSKNGILYDKSLTKIIKVPQGIKGVIDIPEGITSITAETFWYCSGITGINLPNTVKSVGQNAFTATSIKSMVFPDSVKTISKNVFNKCAELKSVHIGSGVTSLTEMFSNCESVIDNITVSDLNEKYKSENNAILSKDGQVLYRANKLGEIPEGVTEISSYAFENNKTLTNITIPENVKYIYRGAFAGCINLAKVTLPQSLWSIDAYCFQNTAISEIVIPKNVKNISCWAFDECTKLTKVTFESTDNWKVTKNGASSTTALEIDVSNAATNAENFLGQYYDYKWERR